MKKESLFLIRKNKIQLIEYINIGDLMNDLVGIIVDSGHGGIDSGAVGNNLQEKDLTLMAGKYIYNRLQELGIPSVLTRDDDVYLPKADRKKY